MTRNIGVYPSAEKESQLSQILEEDVPERYRLSPKACRGILNRAARRGKELPEELKAALEAQANPMWVVKTAPTVCKETESTEQTTPDATAEDGEKTKAIRSTQSTDRQFANAGTLGTANPNGYTAETVLGTDCQATNQEGKAETESSPEITVENSGGGAFHHRLIPSARESMSGVNALADTGDKRLIGFTNRGILTGNICETSRAESHGAIPMVAEKVAVDCYNHTIQGDITATITAHTGASSNGAGSMVMEGNAIGIDHVLMSGGTTFQGRGWYDNVSGCLKTQAHGVMTNEKNDDPE